VELKQFLDSAELQSRPFADPPSGLPVDELEVIFLFIPRGEHVQRLSFWKYFDARRIGSGGMPNITDNGTKLLKPLNRWLKANIEEKEGKNRLPRTDAIATNCAPTAIP